MIQPRLDHPAAEFYVDVFNVLADQAFTRHLALIAGSFSTSFGEPIEWVPPRAAGTACRESSNLSFIEMLADDHAGVAVPVDIACRRHGHSEACVCLARLGDPQGASLLIGTVLIHG